MTDSVLDRLAALPELDRVALRPGPEPRLDEWPGRLQGITRFPATAPPVVTPADTAGVAAVVRWASVTGARIQALGTGSNVVGAIDPDVDLLISLGRLDGVDVDRADLVANVGAGRAGGSLEEALQVEGLTLGHYPQSLHVSTVGGWVATRATGTYSARYGGIERLLVGAEYVQPDGEVVRVRPRPRPSGGLDLLALLCGSEGSLGIVTEVSLALSRQLPERRLCAVFADLARGLDAERELAQAGLPLGLVRLYNAAESQHVATPGAVADGECLLVVTTIGPEAVAQAAADVAAALIMTAEGRLIDAAAADPWFARRYAAAGFMADRNREPEHVFDTIEVALPWSTSAACAADLERRLAPISRPFYMHFSHVYGTGVCLYAILSLQGREQAEAHDLWRRAWTSAFESVAHHGGTLAHHHGIGAQRADRYRPSPEARMHRRLREACDPGGVLAVPALDSDAALFAAAPEPEPDRV